MRGDLPVRRPFHREILSRMYSKTFRILFRMPFAIFYFSADSAGSTVIVETKQSE